MEHCLTPHSSVRVCPPAPGVSPPSPPPLRVQWVDASTGLGAFATHSCDAGDRILCEPPYVFAQSYETWQTDVDAPHVLDGASKCTPEAAEAAEALRRVRCCFGCGAPLQERLREDCDRIDAAWRVLEQRGGGDSGHNSNDSDVLCAGAPVLAVSTWDLLTRVQLPQIAEAVGATAASEAAAASERVYVTEVDVWGQQHHVYFCTAACETRSLVGDGKRFVVSPPPSLPLPCIGAQRDDAARLRHPTAADVVHFAQRPPSISLRLTAWPTRLDALSTLHAVARRCNARVWLLTLLLAKELHATLESAPVSRALRSATASPASRASAPAALAQSFAAWLRDDVGVVFHERLENILGRYAEGAMHMLSAEQRALLRFTWHALTWWWLLCCAEVYTTAAMVDAGAWMARSCPVARSSPLLLLLLPSTAAAASVDEGHEAAWLRDSVTAAQSAVFPIQLYLQLYWLTNANAHMYVVCCPLYTVWCRWLQSRADSSSTAVDESADSAALMRRLYRLLHSNTGSSGEDSLHATGVALYDVATKLNHSCIPNVAFQPNTSAVAASVVALRAIEAGEQLFTSYIRVSTFGDVASADAARRRRQYLETHYGFVCSCALCAPSQRCNSTVTAD
ncbi:SET domain containing protein [Novymonas esmeraldas]|uniref:SET domain containing protein n=1 Tax=Novymonas esmeraldas TaxID=1808958 RepID=A0AAW0EXY6_9TRYP